jgi:2-amino-4-hydroxy-6-hydroxymethyldihydropteridine diphosphokinase
VTALVGLGGNLGERAIVLSNAAAALRDKAAAGAFRASHLYETRPWGKTDQPDFLNAVVSFETSLDPRALVDLLQQIEKRAGREESERWGPRVLDLDLLDLDGAILSEEGLTLPHPRIAERGFVLVPLCEIEPGWTDPLTGRTAAGMLEQLDPDPAEVRLAGRLNLGEGTILADASRSALPRH